MLTNLNYNVMKKISVIFITFFLGWNIVFSQNCNLNDKAEEHWSRASGALGVATTEQDLLFVLEEYNKALALAPDCPDIYFNMALCREKLAKLYSPQFSSQYRYAIDDFKKYIELNPNASDINNVQNKVNEIKNIINEMEADGTELGLSNLIWYYDQILEHEPSNADIYFNKAIALDKQGAFTPLSYDDAIDCFNKYLELKPNAPDKKLVQNKIYEIEGKKAISRKQIGMRWEGGIIFYVDKTGYHGLVAAPFDQSEGVQWCSTEAMKLLNIVNIKDLRGFGEGKDNTMSIISFMNYFGKENDIYAAKICNDLVLNGYNDWYLPSIGELSLLLPRIGQRGDFHEGKYWSSTTAWYQGGKSAFYMPYPPRLGWEGLPGIAANNYLRVRAVRKF